MKQSFKQSALVLALAAFAGAAFAQSPSTPPATTGAQTTPMTSPMTPPTGRTLAPGDSADAAWRTLDSSNRGFLQSSDLQGTGISFEQADTNKDGRISKEEFAKAWAAKK